MESCEDIPDAVSTLAPLTVPLTIQVPAGAEENGAADAAAVEAEVDMSMFDLSKKKKKKKKKVKTEGDDEEGGGEGDEREEGEGRYNYETLLERIQVRHVCRDCCGGGCIEMGLRSFFSCDVVKFLHPDGLRFGAAQDTREPV